MSNPKKTIFLDRDGVINLDNSYVYKWEDFVFVPDAVEAMRMLAGAGYQMVVVTNQSGIARGKYSEDQYLELTNEIRSHLRKEGVPVLGILHCPHHPNGVIRKYAIQCSCRKPQPGLLLEASQSYGIDLYNSILVGDKPSDIYAAKNAGVRFSYLVKSDNQENVSLLDEADAIFNDLFECTKWILERDPLNSVSP